MEELMLKIDNVTKQYRLGQIGGTTMRDELQRLSARLHGREDPTRRIGARTYEKNETFMALKGVSLEVKKGERVGIIGHNGAGKSTLLKLISRVTGPTSGTISLNGRVASMLEVGTGFHGELTGRENIYMNGAILGMTKKEIDSKIEQIIDFSEVRQFIDTPVKRYSSGMYVKLAFSVAAHLDSEIMIMDEVLAVGDLAFQKKCLDKMNDVSRQQGRTILYVSHNMNTIRQLCDRVVVLDKGLVVFDGDVEEGIGVYMGAMRKFDFHYEYPDMFHTNRYAIGGIRIQELFVLNTDKTVFETGDTLNLKLKYSAEREFEKVLFRFVITINGVTHVGTILSEDSVRIRPGEDRYLNFSLSLNHLMNGHFRFDIIAFHFNNFGREQVIDGVYPGFFIDIQNRLNEDCPIVWLPQYWSFVQLEKAKILES
ncbi:MAG: ATP-binding cassette domain-containing protein [Clostridia bacterium]|nr:ATP-binding cassette domain-containing protein [Clostridia bacterium]